MAVLALQTVPAEQGKHLWQCWSPTGEQDVRTLDFLRVPVKCSKISLLESKPGQWLLCDCAGLDLSLSRKALEQPPPLAAWVTAVYNAAVSRVGGGDVSFTESIKRSTLLAWCLHGMVLAIWQGVYWICS